METLSVLKKLKETTKTIGNVTVVTMLTEEGLPHVSETMAIVSSFGFAHDFNVVRGTRHSTSPEFKEYFNDFNPKNDLYLADYKKMETMVSGLFKNVSSVPENILEKLLRSKYHYQLQFHFSGTTGLLCTAGRTNVVLRANGDISVCEMLKPLGNIQESNCNFRKFWQGTAVKNILKIVERCSCSHDCAIVNAIPYNTTALQRLFGKTD
jgi:MoaA/NifB/PqqE/SkfB family radical SAM enzyme